MYFTANVEGGDGTYHASIISTANSQEIKYAAHTREKFDEPLSDGYLDDDDVCIIRMNEQNG